MMGGERSEIDLGQWRQRLRPRRLRRTEAIRSLVRESTLLPSQLVWPLFLVEGSGRREPVEAMPGRHRLSIDEAVHEITVASDLGIKAIALFPRIDDELKSADGAEALNPENLLLRAVRRLKACLPEICLITDVALDPYSSHGHDGIVVDGQVANDETVEILMKMAVLHAEAGADFVAPSDMMDGRIGAIRDALDERGKVDTGIISYAVKYASSFYGPFRQALDSAPVDAPGIPTDKKSYQVDPANAREAEREVELDEAEGADIVMVKPGMPCLDIIARIRRVTTLPIAAYQVSGEYAMIHAAGLRGWIDARMAMTESLMALRRSGADLIFSYAAVDYARWWRESMK